MSWNQGELPLYQRKAGLFKGLSHPVRIRVLELLADGAEHTVGDLIESTGLEPSHLSQHLSVLRQHGLVISERRASYVHYRIAYPEVAELLSVARALLGLLVSAEADRAVGVAALPSIAPGEARQDGPRRP